MELTAWDIYWVMQLDSIGGMFFGLLMIGMVMGLAAFVSIPLWADRDMCEPSLRKWIVGLPAAVMFLGGLGSAFLPSTKTAAAMIVVPAIVNNETIQREAGDLYGLAKQALAEAVKPDEPETKE